MNTFDKNFWDSHWQRADGPDETTPTNPYVAAAVAGLRPGTALDAGCGEGAEAVWLAEHDWQVTAADLSGVALARAAERSTRHPVAASRLQWVEADLTVWEPPRMYDLVMTHYAHPAMPQLEFYRRLAGWVAPGGTLLIVGHLHHAHEHEHTTVEHPQPPEEATVTADGIVASLDLTHWAVLTAEEVPRTMTRRDGTAVEIDDVVVIARRNGATS